MCSNGANLGRPRRSSAGPPPSRGRSLVQSQLHDLGIESLGFQLRRSRELLASFLGKEVAAKQTEVS